jgi:hypothetical protein
LWSVLFVDAFKEVPVFKIFPPKSVLAKVEERTLVLTIRMGFFDVFENKGADSLNFIIFPLSVITVSPWIDPKSITMFQTSFPFPDVHFASVPLKLSSSLSVIVYIASFINSFSCDFDSSNSLIILPNTFETRSVGDEDADSTLFLADHFANEQFLLIVFDCTEVALGEFYDVDFVVGWLVRLQKLFHLLFWGDDGNVMNVVQHEVLLLLFEGVYLHQRN